ncbi:hypothetical protein [Kribbella sp. NPDC051770]|uniref:hypothetical protein n=1 Tax=Kribbella sp. NPDC051770 TaxID=3155413 RepID=UPI00343114B9
MPLPARLAADVLEEFRLVAYLLHRHPQSPDYVRWLADRVCSNVSGLYEWAEVKDALDEVVPLTAAVQAFLDRGLLPSQISTAAEAFAEAAARIERIESSGRTEFAQGRQAGLKAAAIRVRDWHQDDLRRDPFSTVGPLLDKPAVPRTPVTATWTKAARHAIRTDRDPVERIRRILSTTLDHGGSADRGLARRIAWRLPTGPQMVADRDALRRQLLRLRKLEQTIRLDWDPTPERLRTRAEVAAGLHQLATSLAPTGAHGSSYGMGFAAGFGRAQAVVLEVADEVRGVWLPGLTAKDVAFPGQ